MPYKRNAELPKSVRSALPEGAQSVFRAALNAFMGREGATEQRGFAVAWAAVKRGWREPDEEGGQWVKRAQDSFAIEEVVALDAAAGIRRTADGYLVAHPRVARTGIQVYKGSEMGRPDMDTVRVFRPEAEVFHKDSLGSYAFRPVTNDHPPVSVTSDNWKEYSVGQTGDEVARDGEFVRVPMVLMDRAAISDVENGKAQLSLGYVCDVKFEAGVTAAGEKYDAVQSNIRANHLAVVAVARGGSDLRIGDVEPEDRGVQDAMTDIRLKTIVVDGIECQVADVSAAVISRHLAAMQGRIDTLTAELEKDKEDAKKSRDSAATAAADSKKVVDAKDAENATLKTQLADVAKKSEPAAIDAAVRDRAATIDKAKKIVGDKLVADGKTAQDIRRQVVDAKLGDAAKGWTDDQVSASFAALTAGDSAAADPLARALRDQPRGNQAGVDAAYEARDKSLADAWRNPASKTAAAA